MWENMSNLLQYFSTVILLSLPRGPQLTWDYALGHPAKVGFRNLRLGSFRVRISVGVRVVLCGVHISGCYPS